MKENQYEEMRKLITTQKQYLKSMEQLKEQMIAEIEQLKYQLQAKNTFLIEKHLTSQYSEWLVEYNKQKRAT